MTESVGEKRLKSFFFNLLSNFIKLRMQLVRIMGKQELARALHEVSCKYSSRVRRYPVLQIHFILRKATK